MRVCRKGRGEGLVTYGSVACEANRNTSAVRTDSGAELGEEGQWVVAPKPCVYGAINLHSRCKVKQMMIRGHTANPTLTYCAE